MLNSLPLLIAWRYTIGTRQQSAISSMALICFMGMFVGSFALALIICVMNGFEKATHEKLQGIHAQITMRSTGNDLDYPAIAQILDTEFPQIAAHTPGNIQQVIIQNTHSNEITHVVVLKGINPASEELVTTLPAKLIEPENISCASLLDDTSIVIGAQLAQELDVKPGQMVDLLFSTDNQPRGRTLSLSKHAVHVAGIFKTGIEDIDTSLALCSLPLLHNLFPDSGTSFISLKLKPHADEAATIKALHNRFDLEVYSWKDLYPPLVAALKLEKYAMFLILLLITLVASMSIISLLFMQITYKRGDIAILSAMGMAPFAIQKIFLYMGICIAMIGTICGLVAAYIVARLLEKYPFIELPDSYYVSHLPVSIELHWFALIFVAIIGISIIAIWIPVRNIPSINIAHVLRYEG